MRVQFGNTQINLQLKKSKDKKQHNAIGAYRKDQAMRASDADREKGMEEYYFRL